MNSKIAIPVIMAAIILSWSRAAYAAEAIFVSISTTSQKLAGVELGRVHSESQAEILDVTGRIIQDAQNLYHLKSVFDGVFLDTGTRLGQTVNKGDILGTIVSSTVEERVTASSEGVVTGVSAEAGSPVRVGDILFTITGIDPVWAVLDISEKDIAKLRLRQSARVNASSYPGRTFSGETVFISPEIDELSRTVKVRVKLDNPGGLLKFGMFITAELPIADDKPSLYVPLDSLQRTPDGWIVFVRVAPDKFEARRVTPARETKTEVEILKGLRTGETIATKGAFMLKSEMMKGQLGEE